MLRQIVKDYEVIDPIIGSKLLPGGESASPKELIFHIMKDNAANVEVLDIGFGKGGLGDMLKANPATAHWSVDGVDGFEGSCQSVDVGIVPANTAAIASFGDTLPRGAVVKIEFHLLEQLFSRTKELRLPPFFEKFLVFIGAVGQ